MSSTNSHLRTVDCLPLKALDRCCQCNKKTDQHVCAGCGDRVYCSQKCQMMDWIEHKAVCKETERLDLTRFWPFFAYMAELARSDKSRPEHPALYHKILNDPVPNTIADILPDGTSTNLVMLGDPITQDKLRSTEWWPTAQSESIRNKLFLRIFREGYSVPIVVSICVALLAEMYMTTYDPDLGKDSTNDDDHHHCDQFCFNKRIRLHSREYNIIDFGICKGTAEVTTQDTFGYISFSRDKPIEFFRGQDPKDHYWIYFKTLREELTLDLSMFTFNFAMCIGHAEKYTPTGPFPQWDILSAFFCDRDMRQSTPALYREKQRFSVLHHKALQSIVRTENFDKLGEGILVAFMELVAGRKTNEIEKKFVVSWTTQNRVMLSSILYHQDYLKTPVTPQLGIEYDPGEKRLPRGEEAGYGRFNRAWTRKEKKGEITQSQLKTALSKWDKLPPEEKMAWRKRT